MGVIGFVTLTGVGYKELFQRLEEPLPNEAFKPVPGGAGLTDINTGYAIERVSEIFGPRGLGWGLDYAKEDLVLEATTGRTTAHLKHAVFYYVLVDTEGEFNRFEIPTSALNTNTAQYAEEGARTSAIGTALKQLGFQNAIYKNEAPEGVGGNQNSGQHKPPRQAGKPKAPAKEQPKQEEQKPEPEKPAEETKKEEAKAPASNAETVAKAEAYIVPSGVLYAGRTFGQVRAMPDGAEALEFLAGRKPRPTDGKLFDPASVEDGTKLQNAAKYLLDLPK